MISIDQLQALEALEKEKSFHRAAESLSKSYGAFTYLIQTLESQLDLKLLDRSGYRSQITAEGRAVLKYGVKLQQAHVDFVKLCKTLRSGWEPQLQIVSDGIFNQQKLIAAIQSLRISGVSTQVETFESHLEEVETQFQKKNADLMILVSPLRGDPLPYIALRPSRMVLVCSAKHPLAKKKRWIMEDLRRYDFVAIGGSIGNAKAILILSTSELEQKPTFTVGDFNAKKYFIESGLAFGWLPEEMILKELKTGVLKKISTEISSVHTLQPRLYHRPIETLGKASLKMIDLIKSIS